MKPKYEAMAEYLVEELPHGSGIDYDWIFSRKGRHATFHNGYHVMNDNGYYIGTAQFRIVVDLSDPEEFKLYFEGDRYSHYLARRYGLREYLEDTIAMEIGEMMAEPFDH